MYLSLLIQHLRPSLQMLHSLEMDGWRAMRSDVEREREERPNASERANMQQKNLLGRLQGERLFKFRLFTNLQSLQLHISSSLPCFKSGPASEQLSIHPVRLSPRPSLISAAFVCVWFPIDSPGRGKPHHLIMPSTFARETLC